VKIIKFCVAVLLLPACGALTLSAGHVGRALLGPPTGGFGWSSPAVAFATGYGLWLVAFVLLPKPMRTYVLGHELTHAFWALLMGARVGELKVRKTGGQVKTSKTNWFITLAPYFFPFYAMLFIGLFFAANAIWGLDRYLNVLFFLIGLGWSFHVTFTLLTLLQSGQPDLRSQGFLFSAVVIYCMNLLVLLLTATLLSQTFPVTALVGTVASDCATAYGWTLDNFLALWHYAASLLNH
jgi:hypothetical protein